MRTILLVLGLTYLALAPVMASAQTRRCGTTEYLDRQISEDPAISLKMVLNEELIQKVIANQSSNRTTSTIYTIPVVFHVMWRTTTQNVSAARLADQLNVLNADFGRLNADTGNTPAAFRNAAGASTIQFCMATRDPNGNWTNGIVRKFVNVNGFDPITNDNVKYTSLGGSDAWPTSDYLNIWVCNFSGASAGLLGISQMPGLAPATDGCVVLYSTVGGFNSPGTLVDFNHGRTLTHEVGHWFALYHIWGDDGNACTGTDHVSDTPNQADENYGCPTYPTTDACTPSSPGVMTMNYMDYTNDDCMNMFTDGQVLRLHSAVTVLRNSLLGSVGCWAPVGMEALTAGEGFVVYPNPTAGSCEASVSFNTPVDLTLRVENAMGQLVISRDFKDVSTMNLPIDLSGHAPGLYVVSIRTSDFFECKRVILEGR